MHYLLHIYTFYTVQVIYTSVLYLPPCRVKQLAQSLFALKTPEFVWTKLVLNVEQDNVIITEENSVPPASIM